MKYYGWLAKRVIFKTEEEFNEYARGQCYWHSDFTQFVKDYYPDALECYLGALACEYNNDDILFDFPLMLRRYVKEYQFKYMEVIDENEIDKYLQNGWKWYEPH